MYAVVACLFFAVVVYAAACYDNNIGALADIEVVIHKVVYVAVGNAGGNINRFTDSKGLYTDIYSGLVVL